MPFKDFKPTVYIGPSMNPTLRAPDILEITPYKDELPRVGDVIVFDSPLEKKSITHRVIAVTRSGIYTRGDNNRAPDPWRLKPKHITGRVDRIKKGKKTETIINGRAGMWLARFLYARNYAKRILYKVLRPVYRAINKVNFLPVLFHQIMAAKIVVFKKADHKELQLLLGKHVIGRKVVGKKWRVKLPYRLLINPRLLPK